jgi:O-antigen ligase
MYAAGALFLALLNLRLAHEARARMLHLSIAGIALFCVISGFGRAVYAGVAIVGLLFFVTSRAIRGTVLSVVPLALPFVVMLAIGVNQAAPEFVGTVNDRMFSAPETDANVQWRVEANRAVLDQVREQPLFGVGFGRGSEFYLQIPNETTGLPAFQGVEIGQDPHNGYVYLLAGGGIVALGAFALLLATFGFDAVRRYRSSSDPRARLIVLWASATLFVFLLNAASGTSFGRADNILTIWALLVLPAVVRPTTSGDSGSEREARTDEIRREGRELEAVEPAVERRPSAFAMTSSLRP